MRSRSAYIRVTRGRKSVPKAAPLALHPMNYKNNEHLALTRVAPYQEPDPRLLATP